MSISSSEVQSDNVVDFEFEGRGFESSHQGSFPLCQKQVFPESDAHFRFVNEGIKRMKINTIINELVFTKG